MKNSESENKIQIKSNRRLRSHEELDSGCKRPRHEVDDNSCYCNRVYSKCHEELDSKCKQPQHELDDNSNNCNRVNSKLPEFEISVDVNKIRDDIFDILDELEDVTEIQDLDSIIKSFEEEILHSTPATDPGELGYLLEASDDELGLPPANSTTDDKSKEQLNDLVTNSSFEFGFEENAEFENEIPSYDSFDFGFGEEMDCNDGNGDFESDLADFLWLPGSLPAH